MFLSYAIIITQDCIGCWIGTLRICHFLHFIFVELCIICSRLLELILCCGTCIYVRNQYLFNVYISFFFLNS